MSSRDSPRRRPGLGIAIFVVGVVCGAVGLRLLQPLESTQAVTVSGEMPPVTDDDGAVLDSPVSVEPVAPPGAAVDPAASAPIGTPPLLSEIPATDPAQPGTAPPIAAPVAAEPSIATNEAAPTNAVPATSMPAMDLMVPVSGVSFAQLSDTFTDARGQGRSHDAIDIMAATGTPVVAVADGTIAKLFDSKPGGHTIYQFDEAGRHAFYYAHLDQYAPGLAEGQKVTRGQVIGTVGYSGNASPEAPHLHFAVFALGPEKKWWQGTPINPYTQFRQR